MRLLTLARATPLALALAGCGRDTTTIAPTAPTTSPSTVTAPPGYTGYAAVCKVGPAGVYTVHADASSGTNALALLDVGATTDASGQHADFTLPVDPAAGPCQAGAGRVGLLQYGEAVTLGLTETNIPSGLTPVRWDVYCDRAACDQTIPIATQLGGATFTYVVGATDQIKIVLTNGQAAGGSGCTPGYWKAPQHFDSWPSGYLPTQLVGAYFPSASLYTLNGTPMSAYTLAQGLAFQGGSDPAGGAQILLRAGIAGLLNSATAFSSPYPVSTANLLTAVDNALASGNRTTMVLLGTVLDGYNNGGCRLN